MCEHERFQEELRKDVDTRCKRQNTIFYQIQRHLLLKNIDLASILVELHLND